MSVDTTGEVRDNSAVEGRGGDMKRRLMLITVALSMSATLGLSGTAGAAPASPAGHFKAGQEWTLSFPYASFCEVQTMAKHKKFTADNGDHGFWQKDAKEVREVFYEPSGGGPLAGDLVNGNYSKKLPGYSGYMYDNGAGTEYYFTLVMGATPGC